MNTLTKDQQAEYDFWMRYVSDMARGIIPYPSPADPVLSR